MSNYWTQRQQLALQLSREGRKDVRGSARVMWCVYKKTKLRLVKSIDDFYTKVRTEGTFNENELPNDLLLDSSRLPACISPRLVGVHDTDAVRTT